MIGIILFVLALTLLFCGYSVAFTFAGVSLIVGLIFMSVDLFEFMPYRIMAIMENTVLMAVPMFIFMGVILQKSGLAERLLESMGKLFGGISGGVAISTVVVGAFLAIVPPSIILIILGDVMGIPVGDLFKAALVPSMLLISSYIVYLLALGRIKPDYLPPVPTEGPLGTLVAKALMDIIPTLLLILAVLGSIFTGIATPTESAALGGVGALILAGLYGGLNLKNIKDSSLETVKVTSMVFAVLLGATAFSMVFSYSGGDHMVADFMLGLPGEKWTFIAISMIAILLLGFFIDFIEIAFIVVPIITPIAYALGLDMVWFAILIAMNLQTSFLTPPFGFSLFYLKGVAPPEVSTATIYKGVIPFIILQMIVLGLIIGFPGTFIIT